MVYRFNFPTKKILLINFSTENKLQVYKYIHSLCASTCEAYDPFEILNIESSNKVFMPLINAIFQTTRINFIKIKATMKWGFFVCVCV